MSLAEQLAYLIAAPCPEGAAWPGAGALLSYLQPRNVDRIPPRPGPGVLKTFVELADPAVPYIELEDDSRGWGTRATLHVEAGTIAEVAQAAGPLTEGAYGASMAPPSYFTMLDRGTHHIQLHCYFDGRAATRVDLFFSRRL